MVLCFIFDFRGRPQQSEVTIIMSVCNICPRRCGADRRRMFGFCGVGEECRIARIMRHSFEEPCISGSGGAGAVFFVGCNLGCVFCQNSEISHPRQEDLPGEVFTPPQLAGTMLELQAAGLSCIDLVTPTHFTPKIAEALRLARRGGLTLPVVWNSGGYETPEALAMVADLIDVYMPDIKYLSSDISQKYSAARDYAERAAECIAFMYKKLGAAVFLNGMMRRGLLVRHLVLPGCRHDSIAVLRRLAETVPPADIRLSLMSQYTPDFYRGDDRALSRRLTAFEYDSVLAVADELGFDGYMQAPTSGDKKYTPDFLRPETIDPDCRAESAGI